MGAGKTTLGRKLAEMMKLSFLDLDHYIEQRYHRTVSEIFAERGEAGFREIERQLLHEVGTFENVIVATGGGVSCFYDNASFMNSHGISVYLKTSVPVLFNRLRIAKNTRPILSGKTDEELEAFISQSLSLREPYYKQATLIFDADNLDSREQILEATVELSTLLENHFGSEASF